MSDRALQIACLDVAGACYALPISALREIVRLPEISRLPDAPPLVEGLIDLRGSLVPVVDLARVVGARRISQGDSARVAVVSAPDLLLGLIVDAANEVVSIGVPDCEAIPEIAEAKGARLVHTVIRRDGQTPIMILSIEGLIDAVSASAMRGEAA